MLLHLIFIAFKINYVFKSDMFHWIYIVLEINYGDTLDIFRVRNKIYCQIGYISC